MKKNNFMEPEVGPTEETNQSTVDESPQVPNDQPIEGVSSQVQDAESQKIEFILKLRQQIQALSLSIRKGIFDRYEPIEDLFKLNSILADQFDDVWEMLHTPAEVYLNQENPIDTDGVQMISEQSQDQDQQIDPSQKDSPKNLQKTELFGGDVKLDFYEHVLKQISQVMLNEGSISNADYLQQIIVFFRTIITKFLLKDLECPQLIQIASNLFDWERNLHFRALSNYRNQDFTRWDYKYSAKNQRIQDEMDWRFSLKIGDKIDVLRRQKVKDIELKSWGRGTVVFKGIPEDEESTDVNMDGNPKTQSQVVDVKFDLDYKGQIQRYHIFHMDMAPFGTYTDDYEWRYDIKVGDEIDCMDNDKEFFKSTVVAHKIQNNHEGEPIPIITVGFRTFDEEGNKQDEETQKKFFGWSQKYDEVFSVTDPQIQRLYSCTQQYKMVEMAHKLYQRPHYIDDKEDTYYPTKDIAAFCAKRERYFCKSDVIIDALNEFGRNGGFERFLQILEEGSQGKRQLSLNIVFDICYFFNRTLPLWHRQFLCKVVPRFNSTLLKLLSYQNPEYNEKNRDKIIIGVIQDEKFDKQMMENLINYLIDPVWKAYYTTEMIQRILNIYRVEIGASMIKLTNLQKRIDGMRHISYAISQVCQTYPQYKLLYAKELVDIMRRLGVFENVFCENTHYQLITRSDQLIRLFFSEKVVLPEEIDLIWAVCNKLGHIHIKLEIYKIILDVLKVSYITMSDETKEYFIDKLKTVNPSDLIEKDIELITELGKKGGYQFRKPPDGFVKKSADFLWSIAVLDKEYPRIIAPAARKKFCEAVQNWEDPIKEIYVSQAIDNITSEKLPLQNLKIAKKLIEKMNTSQYPAGKRTRKDFLCDLIEHQDFITILIDDMENYITFANSVVEKGDLNPDTVKTYEHEGAHLFTHFKNVRSRLKILRNMLVYANAQMTAPQMERVYDIFVQKSALKVHDQNVFFWWFKLMINLEKGDHIEDNVMESLFRSKIVNSDLAMANDLKLNGFDSVIKLFIHTNAQSGNIIDLDPPKKKSATNNYMNNNWQNNYTYTSTYNYSSNTTTDSSYAKLKFDKFSINVPPKQLEGIHVLWRLLVVCETSYNSVLFQLVKNALLNTYTHLSTPIENMRSEISDSFILDSLNCLASVCKDEFVVKNEKNKKETIKQLCQMITNFFEQSEQNGLGNLQIHKQIEEGFFMQNLQFDNQIRLRKGVDARFISLDIQSNMSIWMLKKIIAKFTDNSPLCIDIKRCENNKRDLKDAKNSNILYEFGLQDGEKFVVNTKKIPDPQMLPLLNSEGELVPELYTIFDQLFDCFSEVKSREDLIEESGYKYGSNVIDQNHAEGFLKENEIPDEEQVMTRQLLSDCMQQVTRQQRVLPEDQKISDIFKSGRRYNNLMNRQEFMAWYKMKAGEKPSAVRENIANLGYYPNFQRKIDAQTLNFENDTRIIKDENCLARSKISAQEEVFDQLLQLVEQSKGSEADGIWSLINNLETNKNIYEKILGNECIEELFNIKGEGSNLYKVLYCIQIIQSLIYEYKVRQEGTVTCYIENVPGQAQVNGKMTGPQAAPDSTSEPQIQDVATEQQDLNQDKYEDAFPTLPTADDLDREMDNFGETKKEDGSSASKIITIQNIESSSLPYMNISPTNAEPREGGAEQRQKEEPEQEQVENQGAAPNVIALGYNGPFRNPQQQQNNQDVDIPMAPRSNAMDVGPPNSYNTAVNYSSLNDFKGQTVVHPIKKVFESTGHVDGRRKEWLPQFLDKGGLQKLIELIKELSKIDCQKESQMARIARKVLSEVMECVRILLICLFCSELSSQDQVIKLQRKQSYDPQHDTKADDKTGSQAKNVNKLQQIQDTTIKEMEPLIQLLRDPLRYEQNQALVVGLEEFQKDILGILAELIERQTINKNDENSEIIAAGLSIWMSCLAKQPEIFNHLIDAFEKGEDKSDQSSYDLNKFVHNMVNLGICSSDFKVRDSFESVIQFIVEFIRRMNLQQLPLVFFMKMMISKLDHVQNHAQSKHTRQFFRLIREFMPKYFIKLIGPNPIDQIFESSVLIKQIINRLSEYESTEKRSNIIMEDETLIGLIDMISMLLQFKPDCLNAHEIQELTKFILEKCLFTLNFEPISEHITKKIDLEEIEKKNINKCHTKDSKQASYNLLLVICRNSQVPEIVNSILEDYWLKQVYRVDKPEKAGFSPQADARSYYGFCGIKNLGAVCYMNSMMQQFYNVPTFRFSLMAANDEIEADYVKHQNKDIDDNVLHQMMNQFAFLQLSDRQYYNPTPFCFSFKEFDGQPTNVRVQKDAQEFLNIGFDRIETALKDTTQKHLINNVFGGESTQTTTCMTCGNISKRVNTFLNISLEVKNQTSVMDGLNKYIATDTINDYMCDACKKRGDCQKRETISNLPNTMIIHLQRITYDFEVDRVVKYNDRIQFPNILSLKEFTTQYLLEKDKKTREVEKQKEDLEKRKELDAKQREDAKDDDVQAPPKDVQGMEEQNVPIGINEEDQEEKAEDDEEFEYKLVGVVCHMGSAEAGHYFSYINTERDRKSRGLVQNETREEWGKTESQTWLEFNDHQVSKFNFKDIEENCYGGRHNQSAYMLFYEKRLKKDVKVVIPDQIKQSLACDGTAMSSADYHLFSVYPDLFKQIQDKKVEIKYDEEKKEHTVELEFEQAEKFVPNKIYQMVHHDNQKYLSEKQVFSEPFYKCTLELLQISIQHAQKNLGVDQQKDLKIFEMTYKLVDRVIFDLMVNSSANKELANMSDILLLILSKSDEAVLYLVQQRIFAPAETVGENERNFFETLSTHPEKNAREMASQIMLYTIGRLLEIGGEQEVRLAHQAIDEILNQMDKECQKHWARLDTYLDFLYSLVKSSFDLMKIMVEKRVVARLVDLMSKYNPQSLLYVTSNPPLEKLVLTVSFIVRSIPCIIDQFDSTNLNYFENQNERQNELQILLQERGTTAQHIPLEQSFSKRELEGQDLEIVLSDQCLQALFMAEKKYKLFYDNVTKHGFESLEFSRMVAHLCFKNKEYSSKIARQVLKGVNTTQADELAPVLEIWKQFLGIDDEYFYLRVEWIFGVSNIMVRSGGYQSVYNQAPKIGVSYADSVGQQVIKYFSPLFKNGNTMYTNKNSALQAMIHGRKQHSKSVLFSLQAILNCALADKQLRLVKFMKEMDTFCYQYARYWDWIKPWVASEVDSNTRNQSHPAYRNELELSINVLSLIEEVEKNYSKVYPDSTLDNGVITYPENDIGPQPYLIWEIESYDCVDRKEDPNYKVSVVVMKLVCSVSRSLPTGENNYSLMDHYSSSGQYYYQGYQGGSVGCSGGIRSQPMANYNVKRTMGRGQRGNLVRQNKMKEQKWVAKNNQLPRNQQKNNLQIRTGGTQEDNDADSEDESPTDDKKAVNPVVPFSQEASKSVRFVVDDGEQTNQVNSERYGSNGQDDMMMPKKQKYQQLSDDTDEAVPVASNIGEHAMNLQTTESPSAELQMQVDTQDIAAASNSIPSPPTTQIEEQQDDVTVTTQETQDEAIREEDENKYYQSQCVLLFKVENGSGLNKTIKLRVKPKDDGPLNFRCPLSDVACEVYTNTTQEIINLTKLDPEKDWGDFEWDFEVVDKSKVQTYSQVGSYPPATGEQVGATTDNYTMNDGNGSGAEAGGCPTCTFINAPGATNCEMCGADL